MRKNNIKDYKNVVRKLGEYFNGMDNKYYSELEGKSDDMKELTEYLNNFKLSF